MEKIINVLYTFFFLTLALLKFKFTRGPNSKTQTQRSVFMRCVEPPQLSQKIFK